MNKILQLTILSMHVQVNVKNRDAFSICSCPLRAITARSLPFLFSFYSIKQTF